MKYYVLEITTVNGETAKSVWEFDNITDAKSRYYGILSSAYANPNLTYALVQIINDIGYVERMERIPIATDEVE